MAIKAAKTPAQEQAAYKALADDEVAFRVALFAIQWPPDMKADANALVSGVSSEITACQNAASSPNPLNDVSAQAAITTANAAGNAAADVVRHDLRLPPIS